MKKLDWLVVKSFIGPFILTFWIAQFVLVMQFLWKYIDDLVGKGLDSLVLMELIVYASASLVPMALPLAVLLASIMTYGAFGEHFELTAVRSAGISLLRFMKPLIVTVILISAFALFFSNNIMPLSNLKFRSLLYDISHQKPSIALKPGIFYSGIDGFFLKVESKDEETNTLRDITVYDHTSGQGNDHVITAVRGEMVQDEEALALTLKLEDGKQYREMDPKEPKEPKDVAGGKENTHQMVHTTFKTWEKRFDLSEFKLNRTDESFFKDLKQMLNLTQLLQEMDTLEMESAKVTAGMASSTVPYYNIKKFGLDTLVAASPAPLIPFKNVSELLGGYDKNAKIQIMERAMNKVRNVKNMIDITAKQLEFKDRDMVSHLVEVYRKFTLSIACLVLFFIGAPLGSIIRKGGLGWPLFYCVIFFIIYHVTSIIGEKLAEKDVLTPFSGMWLSTFILLPVGFFLTLKATNDSKIYSTDYYRNLFRKIFPSKAAI